MEEENKTEQVEETEAAHVDQKAETIHFPWTIAIIIAVLMVLIITCFVIVMILGPIDPATSSSQNISSSL